MAPRDGAIEELRPDYEVHHRPGRQQDLPGPERLPVSAGAGLELHRAAANQILRQDEMAGQTGMYRPQPVADPRAHGVDLHGKRMSIGDFDRHSLTSRPDVTASGVRAGRECQQQRRNEDSQSAKHVPSLRSAFRLGVRHDVPIGTEVCRAVHPTASPMAHGSDEA